MISLLPLLKDIPEAFAADPDGFPVAFDQTLKVKMEKHVVSCGFGHLLARFDPLEPRAQPFTLGSPGGVPAVSRGVDAPATWTT